MIPFSYHEWSSASCEGVKLHSPSPQHLLEVIERLRTDKTNNTQWTLNLYHTTTGATASTINQINKVHSLVSLGLFQSSIDPVSLSDTLASNTTLDTLWLDASSIGCIGLQQLYKALSANKTLRTLWLTRDPSINDKTILYLAQGLNVNIKTLRQLS